MKIENSAAVKKDDNNKYLTLQALSKRHEPEINHQLCLGNLVIYIFALWLGWLQKEQ